MQRVVWRIAAIVVAIAYTGCVKSSSGAAGDDDGPHAPPSVLQVPTLDGHTEPVWIYVATPQGPGPHPVVVYGHGQGAGNVVNCTPDRAPDDGDAETGKQIADDLAAQGYLAIALFYRNRGEGMPAINELRGRDHYVLDARAFLAAARAARDWGGDSRVALIGVSMGSYPVTWATAPLPELTDLQAGIDIVTTIPTAMLGNHIGNTGRNEYLLTTSDITARRGGIVMASLASVQARTQLALDPSLTADDLDATTTAGITPAATYLLRRAILDAPDPALAGCANLTTPVLCNATCYASTFAAVAAAHGLAGATPTDWLRPETIDAITYWNPPTAIDPGASTSNIMLASQRALSPAYTLAGPLHARRLLPLTSLGDRVVTDQLQGSNAPADLYAARLRATGVTMPSPIPVVTDTSCGHADYLNPTRPQCGWTIVLAELATAFAR